MKVGERMDKYMVDNAMLYAPDGQLIIGENGLPVRMTIVNLSVIFLLTGQ